MANFSSKERFVASLFSATPRLKQLLKNIYVRINAFLYHKRCSLKVLCDNILCVEMPFSFCREESFFGYYDKSPENSSGIIIAHLTKCATLNKPSEQESIQIVGLDSNGEIIRIGKSNSYNWQQGTRAQWLSDDVVIYNDFRDNAYKAVVYSLVQKDEIKIFDYPVQDAYQMHYFLSINYGRIMYLRPDYGYRNLALPEINEMKDLQHDGIWKIHYVDGQGELLYSLNDIIQCGYKELFASCLHKVNHVMINKDGNAFIFIHRFYYKGRRFDRLMYSDFKSLKVLVDNGMVSHCCWIDANTIFGYFRYQNKNGFYYCNIHDGMITPCVALNNLELGDGHPSCHGDFIVLDSYPDKGRMQHLYLYNRKSEVVTPLLEVYQSVRYNGECRCDLHPRFSVDGGRIYFDSVYTGKRTLCFIDIRKLI